MLVKSRNYLREKLVKRKRNIFKKTFTSSDFPGPVDITPASSTGGMGSVPSRRSKIFHAGGWGVGGNSLLLRRIYVFYSETKTSFSKIIYNKSQNFQELFAVIRKKIPGSCLFDNCILHPQDIEQVSTLLRIYGR